MKLDEDLVYEQVENMRDELCRYLKSNLTGEETFRHYENIMKICHSRLISQMKTEQLERDSSHLLDEFRNLNQERIKHWDF